MANTYWHKQSAGQPLFSDLTWSRPENKNQAGKLLIIGGNLYGFAAPAEAYAAAEQTGIGSVRVLLPLAIKKAVGKFIDNGLFAPSTPSGSFSQAALDELLNEASWADGVILAGDLGRNSETAIVVEKFLAKYAGPATITKDAIDYVNSSPDVISHRSKTTLVLSISQLQRLLVSLKYPQAASFDMSLTRLIDLLNDLTQSYGFNVIIKHLGVTYVAVGGQVSTTNLPMSNDNWQAGTAARSAVWWLQNPNQPFEALPTANASN